MEVLIFIYFVFGIIGIQLFQGLLRQRCFSTVPPYEMLEDPRVSSIAVTIEHTAGDALP